MQNNYTKIKREFVRQNPDISLWKEKNPKAVLGLTVAAIVVSGFTVGVSYVAIKKLLICSCNVTKFSCRKTGELLTYLYHKARGDKAQGNEGR